MKKLFLDDIRIPKDCVNGLVPSHLNQFYWGSDWDIVRSFEEFINWITKNGLPDFISFDHDLADIHYEMDFNKKYDESTIERTGLDCAKWLVEYCMEKGNTLPQYIVHSQNPVGKENIRKYFIFAEKHL
jgi:hypothetical protein